MSDELIPLFPLRTVLFPQGPLPLRVFEPRYLDMVSRCMKNDSDFGVVLVNESENEGDVQLAVVGTRARISDWYQGSDGLLGITAVGLTRFRVIEIDRQADGLHLGRVEDLPAEPQQPLPDEYKSMAGLLQAIVEDLGKLYEPLPKNYDDASWVSQRFAEILPMEIEQKQACLEMNDPIERLAVLRPLLRSIRVERSQ